MYADVTLVVCFDDGGDGDGCCVAGTMMKNLIRIVFDSCGLSRHHGHAICRFERFVLCDDCYLILTVKYIMVADFCLL